MNHTYRLVWNEAAQRDVPAAEAARSRGKSGACRALRLLRTIMLGAALGGTRVDAAPIGGTVVAGQGTVSQAGGTTTVRQQSQNLSLNWVGFSISSAETVQFVQPSTTAVALNRVIGTDPSQIYGHLVANGQVFLINPNGVLFAPGAQVDVGGLVASSLNISDADFLTGNYKFQTGSSNSGGSASPASVVNQGSITAAAGGSVALLGGQVSNQGTITAQLGTVALAAGSAMTLDFHGNKLMSVKVDQSAVGALVENRQLIQADGGRVIMTAAARDALVNTVVNNTGVIEARTIQNQDGEIKLLGSLDGGRVNVDGTLDASAPSGGNGGSIETSGAHVEIADTAHITTAAATGKTGTWLVDPTDFTIASSGGDISGATLDAQLANNSVTLISSSGSVSGNGDIFVNDAVSWSANTTLNLIAVRNIQINGTITASGNTAGLTLNYGSGGNYYVNTGGKVTLSGTNPSLTIGNKGYTVINSVGVQGDTTSTTLQGIQNNLSGFYALGTDIDASATSSWNSNWGFAPLGNGSTVFSGLFEGFNHTITGLTINRPRSYIGLFGDTSGTIRDIGLLGGTVAGQVNVGALAGYNTGVIYNSYATASVSSTSAQVGGLVGWNDSGSISNSYATGNVSGINYVGGLVGWNHTGAINNSYASGNVSATGTGSSGSGSAGGLVGTMTTSSTTDATITNSYATGTVQGNTDAGGLVGFTSNGSLITNSYSTGAVTGPANVGGFVGSSANGTTITNSFWNTTTSGQSTSPGGGTGMTTAQIQTQAEFTSATVENGNVNPNWDFTSVWRIYDGYTAPLLKALLTPLTVTADNISSTYNGSTSTAALTNPVYSIAGANTSEIKGSATAYANDRNAGTYAPVLWSDQQGYDITVKNGTLTITPATLTVSGATAANKVYDGTVAATVSGGSLSGVFGADAVTLTQAGAFSDKNVANNKTVTESFGLTGGDAGNYTLSSNTASTTANITPATLTASGATAANKVYDGTVTATVSGGALSGVIGADAVTLTQAGAFSDKNVANNKTVTESFGLTGGDAGNYTLSSNTASTTANITPATLTASGATAANKVYDGTVTATVSGGALSGVIGADAVTLTQAGAFSDKNVANNKTVTESFGLTGGDAGNYTLSSNTASTTASITPATLTASGATAANKVYDGTVTATVSGGSLSGVIGADAVSLTEAGAFSDKNVANNKTVTESFGLTGGDAGNYTLSSNTASTTANITPATLTASGATAANKVYDGTVTATVSGGALSGVIGADAVTLTQAGAFSDKNVANNKTVTESFGLTGGDAGNYTLSSNTASTTASITPATLTASGATAANKVYDGTVTATVSGGSLSGVIGADAVSLTQAGAFSDKNVANNKTVTENFGLTGGDAGNYTLSSNTASTTANITAATLTVGGATAANKVYDGTVTATVSGGSLSGVIGADAVSLTQAGAFSDKNVANNKTVTENFGLTGGDAGNYTLSSNTASTTANITAATLTVGGATAANKVYDGTVTATVSGGSLSGVIGADAVSLTQAGAFSDKNVANNKTVTESFGLTGGDAGNYTLSSNTASTTANITPATLTASGSTAANKVYDGTVTATVSGGALSGVIGADAVSLTQAGAFSDKNVANNKTVTESFGLTGADAGNYTLSSNTASTTASITPATLTASGATAANKVYDGTVTATVSGGALSGVIGADAVSLTQAGAFSDKNVANNKTVTENFGLTGSDAGNYALSSNTASTTANITPATLTASGATAANKVYDGTFTATVSGGSLSGVIGADAVSLTQAGAFSDKNVANNKTVTENFGLTGGDAGNYTLSSNTASTTANITAATLTVGGATAANKVYDGTVTATVSGGSLSGVIGADAVSLTQAGAFSDKNVANNKTVTESFGLTGSDAGNYTLSSNTASTTASITAATLTASGATAANKVYDGTVTATVSGGALSGVIGTDAVSLTQVGAFSDKNVANNKTVTESFGLTGGDAGNYTLSSNTASTTANITPATLTASGATAANKVYDGTVTATVSGGALSGVIGTDAVSLTQAGAFSDKNVANNKTVTESFGLTGGDAGNYTLSSNTASTTANITPATLTASGSTAANKVYDGTVTATVSGGALSGVIGTDAVSLTQAGAFSDKNVANNKTVTESFSLTGGDAGNYTLSSNTASTTASITPATLTASGATAASKTYDGSLDTTISGGVLSGVFSSDSVGLLQTGLFSDRNAGTNKTVTESFALTGSDSGNYILANGTAQTAANITPRTLTVGANGETKTYGQADPTLSYTSSGYVSGTFNGVTVNDTAASVLTGTLTRAAGEAVHGGPYAIGQGSLASNGNYTISYTPNFLRITPATITVTGITANNKPYDATATATLNTGAASLVGRIGSDSLGVTATGVFVNPSAGTGKTVAISNLTLTGAASGNYVLATSGNESSTTTSITPDNLTITADNATKMAGATNPGLTLTYSGFVAGESASSLTTQPTVSTTASATSPAGNYSITASGAADPNYSFTYVPGTLTVLGDAATSSPSYAGALANLSNVGANGTSGSGSGAGEGEAHGAALDCSGYVHCAQIPGYVVENNGEEDMRGSSRGALSLWSLIILDGGIKLPEGAP